MWLIRPSALHVRSPVLLMFYVYIRLASHTLYLVRRVQRTRPTFFAEMDLYVDSDVDASAINPDDDEDLGSIETAGERDPSIDLDGEQISQATGPSIQRTHVSVPRGKKTKRQKQRSKAERQHLMTQVRRVDINQLFVEAEQQLSKQLHFSVFEERGAFLTTLFSSHKSDLSQLCDTLVGEFCSIYERCATGKEKCSRFHMQWHSYCSTFLTEPTSFSEPIRICETLDHIVI